MFHIYKIINNIPNHSRFGWVYIGKTNGNCKDYYCGGVLINRDIKKYGKENFPREIIDWCYNQEYMDFMECFWIQKYNSFGKGYNLTPGGDGLYKGFKNSEEHNKKLSESLKGKPKPPGFIKNLTLLNIGKKRSKESIERLSNSHKGYAYSKEHNKNLSDSLKGKSKHTLNSKKCLSITHKKPVLQLDLNGNLIAEFSSLQEAFEKTGVNWGNISSVCNGRARTTGGFRWEYKNIEDKNNSRNKSVIQTDIKTNQDLKEWSSAKEASKILGINLGSIYSLCNNLPKCYSAGGYGWRYKEWA